MLSNKSAILEEIHAIQEFVPSRRKTSGDLSDRGGELSLCNGQLRPISKANVLSRIVGSKDGIPKVASPIYKQQFNLETGECLDDPNTSLQVYEVREQDGKVFVGM